MPIVRLPTLVALAVATVPAASLESITSLSHPPAHVESGGFVVPAALPPSPGSILDPANGPGGPNYRFSLRTPPQPDGGALLLGAIACAAFIVRRRLAVI